MVGSILSFDKIKGEKLRITTNKDRPTSKLKYNFLRFGVKVSIINIL